MKPLELPERVQKPLARPGRRVGARLLIAGRFVFLGIAGVEVIPHAANVGACGWQTGRQGQRAWTEGALPVRGPCRGRPSRVRGQTRWRALAEASVVAKRNRYNRRKLSLNGGG